MYRSRRTPGSGIFQRRGHDEVTLPIRSRGERIFLKATREEGQSKQKNYLVAAFTAFWVILFFNWLFPDVIPFDTFELWRIRQGIWSDWLMASWPIFAWAVGVTVLVSLFTRNTRKQNLMAEQLFAVGTLQSVVAGVLEEISFRWLIFISAVVGIKIGNFLFFGWAGFGIGEWFELHVAGPVVNFLTLGYLSDVLANPESWAVGAAMLSANAFFRDGHKYLGFFGYVNSWFIGMFMFWLLFQYGLLACILAHFVYDFLIDVVRYGGMVIERSMGWGK